MRNKRIMIIGAGRKMCIRDSYEPLMGAAGVLAAPYVCSGLNDLFAGIWLTLYNARCGLSLIHI